MSNFAEEIKVRRPLRDLIEKLQNRTFTGCTRRKVSYDELGNTTEIKQSSCNFSEYEEVLNSLELATSSKLSELPELPEDIEIVNDEDTLLFSSSEAGLSGKLEISTSEDKKTFVRSKFLSASGLFSTENSAIKPFVSSGLFMVFDEENDTLNVSEKDSTAPFGLLIGELCNITQTTYKFTKE